jgi:hypothetical protein
VAESQTRRFKFYPPRMKSRAQCSAGPHPARPGKAHEAQTTQESGTVAAVQAAILYRVTDSHPASSSGDYCGAVGIEPVPKWLEKRR